VAGSNLPIVRLWTTATRSKKLVLDKIFHNKVSSVAISPDGVLLAAGSDDWRVAVWNMHSGELAYTLTGHKGWVNSVTFSPDGKTLATGAMDELVLLSSATDGRHISSIDNMSGVNSIDFSPDSAMIAVASTDQTVKIWSIIERPHGAPQVLEGHTGSVNSVKVCPKGRFLASGSDDKTVKLWDTSTDEVRTFVGHTNKIWTVAFTPDAHYVISGSEDQTVRIWDVQSGTLHRTIDHEHGLNSVAVSPDGRYLASSTFDDEVRLYDTETWELRGLLEHLESSTATEIMEQTIFKYSVIARGLPKGHSKAVTCIATSPDHKMVASGSKDARVKLWLLDGKELSMLEGHSGPVTTLTFSRDNARLVSSSTDCTLKVWDIATGGLVRTLINHLETIWSPSFSPDGRVFVSCALDCSVRLWDTASWISGTVPNAHSGAPMAVVFSSDSKFLGCGSDDATIMIWDISLRKTSMVLRGHTGPVTSVAFSPDDKTIVSTSEDRTVRIWKEWHTPTPACDVITSDKGTVSSASYSPDGRFVAFCTAGNTVSIWDTKSKTVQQSAEVDVGIKRVAFSRCGQWVETDRGTLSLDHATRYPHAPAILFAQLVTNDWLFKGSEQIMWLPDTHKATCVAVAVAQDAVIMGHASGAISFLDISDAPQDNSTDSDVHIHSGTRMVESRPIEALPSEELSGAKLIEAPQRSLLRSESRTVFGQHVHSAAALLVFTTCAFWLLRHPSYWQNAFTLLLTVLAMTAVLWSWTNARREG
jgi:WD40 repeat protein